MWRAGTGCGWFVERLVFFFRRGRDSRCGCVRGLNVCASGPRAFGPPPPPGPAGPSPRAKMLRLIRKRPNPLNIQSNDAFNRWQRGTSTEYSIKRLISSFWERGKGIEYIYLLIYLLILESRTLSSYSMHCKFRVLVALQGQILMKKRNLRIQGRMQLFRKDVPESFKSCFDSATA